MRPPRTPVTHARSAGHAEVLARALDAYVVAAMRVRKFDEADEALAEAEALAPATHTGLRTNLLETRGNLGMVSGRDLDGAAQAFEQVRKMRLASGDATGATTTAINLAEIEHARGRTEQALKLAQDCFVALGPANRQSFLILLANRCGYLVVLDRFSEARTATREGLPDVSLQDATA